ncbi:MAG TPA: DNA-directed RNA polymerase [Candidatus Nanoarchaeia archaeon]|nr:DNA-directed RNA polymerase [Candidatus Nanoarchaeia archaeon]
MYYELEVRSHVRVPPSKFKDDTKESILKSLNEKFEAYISKEVGAVIAVTEILEIGDGVIIPGDGAAYYDTRFKILTFKPEMLEILLGKVNEITEFGAFISLGALDGMVHVSQTMDDFVSYSKSNTLTGKESKRVLKVGDKCRARITAISYKEVSNPKIGLTMRQPGLGSIIWIDEDAKKHLKEEIVEKASKKEK